MESVSTYIKDRNDFRRRAGRKTPGVEQRKDDAIGKKLWTNPGNCVIVDAVGNRSTLYSFFRVLTECRWYSVHIGISSFASYTKAVVHLGGFNPGVDSAPGLMCRRCAGPGGHSGRSCGIPGGGSRTPGCGSACRSRRWRPDSGGSPRNFSLRLSGSTRSRVG